MTGLWQSAIAFFDRVQKTNKLVGALWNFHVFQINWINELPRIAFLQHVVHV